MMSFFNSVMTDSGDDVSSESIGDDGVVEFWLEAVVWELGLFCFVSWSLLNWSMVISLELILQMRLEG